jgi:hypothetical protein
MRRFKGGRGGEHKGCLKCFTLILWHGFTYAAAPSRLPFNASSIEMDIQLKDEVRILSRHNVID